MFCKSEPSLIFSFHPYPCLAPLDFICPLVPISTSLQKLKLVLVASCTLDLCQPSLCSCALALLPCNPSLASTRYLALSIPASCPLDTVCITLSAHATLSRTITSHFLFSAKWQHGPMASLWSATTLFKAPFDGCLLQIQEFPPTSLIKL